MSLILYILVFAAFAVYAPEAVWQPGTREFFIIIGALGVWRYSWGAVHLVRSAIFRWHSFPKLRRQADELDEEALPSHVFILLSSYRIQAETTARVYQAAITEAIRYGRPTTIVASIAEMADQRLIKAVFRQLAPPPDVRLMFVRRPPVGKRHALACALRAVSRWRPPADSAVVVVDGDTLLQPGCLARSLPFLQLMPEVGGFTTDEDCVVEHGPVLRAWHRLRFAQRHLLMSSMALSGRLLVLTGRMSVFRGTIATHPGFIDAVEADHIDHWRLGRLPLLTGEDKSTWYWLLKAGHRMLYVPDVQMVTIEHPPSRWLLPASTQLMLRWFGNMLRINFRAVALGPRHLGLFTWWSLIDQRLSMWTPLVGPLVALFFAIGKSIVFLYVYALWVMFTRLIQTLTLLSVRPTVSGLYPLLIYFGQVYGALMKTYILFRLDRQRWTRQNITAGTAQHAGGALGRKFASLYLHGLALGALATVVALATNVLSVPRIDALTGIF
ncbi:MAG: glycosyltransferase [Pseudomonadota bacterium]